jgi:hypothetical protein
MSMFRLKLELFELLSICVRVMTDGKRGNEVTIPLHPSHSLQVYSISTVGALASTTLGYCC